MTTTTGTTASAATRDRPRPLEHPGSLLATIMNFVLAAPVRPGDGADARAAAPPQGDDLGRALRDGRREVVHARPRPQGAGLPLGRLARSAAAGAWTSATTSRGPTAWPIDKLEQVADWRDSTVYTPLERKVLEYAEAMTATPPTVTDEMVEALRADLDDAQLVELTEMISVENLRSRTNSALGLTSQGFKDQCDLPPR